MFEGMTFLNVIWGIIFVIVSIFVMYLLVRVVSHAIYSSKYDFIKRIKGVRNGNEENDQGA